MNFKKIFLSLIAGLIYLGAQPLPIFAAGNDAACWHFDAPDTVYAKQSFTGEAVMGNTGTHVWYNDSWGANPHRLGSSDPRENMRWGLRRVSMTSSTVHPSIPPAPPGHSESFIISATAPATPGVYTFAWEMLQEGVEWFGEPCSKLITVLAAPSVNLVATPMTVDYDTTSRLSWTTINVDSCKADGGPWTGAKSVPTGNETTIKLKVGTTFKITCQKRYDINKPPIIVSDEIIVAVRPPSTGDPNNSVCVSVTTVPSIVGVGKTFSASIKMENTGTKAWYKTRDSTPHALGSENPRNNNNWGLSRVILPLEPVNPGQRVTFSFSPRATTTPGTYDFDWQMLEQGVAWFGEICRKEIQVVPIPTVTLWADPTSVPYGGKSDLRWTSRDATACSSSGGSTGWIAPSRPLAGEWLSGPLDRSYIYTITCTGPGGSRSASATVTVGSAPPTVNLTASPAAVTSGGKSHLTWVSSATIVSCTASAVPSTPPWTGSKTPSGEEDTAALEANTTFRINCLDGEGQPASDWAIVTVGTASFGVDLKVDLGRGYVDNGSGPWPLSGVDLKAMSEGTATGDITYKFYCKASDTGPTITETISTTESPHIREHLNLCDYPDQGTYIAKVTATRGGITATDVASITVARACLLTEAPRQSHFVFAVPNLHDIVPRIWQMIAVNLR